MTINNNTSSGGTTEGVPYSGATADLDMGLHKVAAYSLKLYPTPTIASPAIGELYINTAENGLPEIKINNDSSLTIGAEMYTMIVNKTGAPILDGQVIALDGVQGNRPIGILAKADSASTAYVIGVATANIPDNQEGFVTIFGKMGYNTSLLTPGAKQYLSATTAGALTETPPSSPHFVVEVAKALNSTNNGLLLVNPQTPVAGNTALGTDNTIAPTQNAVKEYVDQAFGGITGLVPSGGTTGQVLAKTDGTDYNTEWIDQGGGAPGEDGRGIVSITKIGTVGLVDTYEILYTDSTTETYDVTNGADGADGAPGAPGADGADGVGVPTGGTTGQVLVKIDGTDYNTEWVDQGGVVPENVVVSDTTGITGAGQIVNVVSISNEDYANITTPDPNTLYALPGGGGGSGSGGANELRVRIPGELVADANYHQGVYWRNTTGAAVTIGNVAFGVGIAAAGSGASAAFNVYKSSGTDSDGIDGNATALFSSAIDLTTNYVSDTNVPNTATVENGRWLSIRCTASAGATNKASDAEVVITFA